MLTVGLVVEGVYDEAAITELVLKSVPSEAGAICRRCGNAIQLMRKFPGFLQEFRFAKDGSPVDKALVIRDADHKNPRELITGMDGRIGNRNFPFPVNLLVIVEELEAWLLADEEAISLVTRIRQQPVRDPERLYDPKQTLRRLLSQAGVEYTSEIARQLAAAARPNILQTRCPSFGEFQEAVGKS